MLIAAFPMFEQAELLMCRVIETQVVPTIHTFTALFKNAAKSEPRPPVTNASFWIGNLLQRRLEPSAQTFDSFEKWVGEELAQHIYMEHGLCASSMSIESLHLSMDVLKLKVGAAGDKLEVGAAVAARFGAGQTYFPGEIEKANGDGTYSILYDDGDRENNVGHGLIRSHSLVTKQSIELDLDLPHPINNAMPAFPVLELLAPVSNVVSVSHKHMRTVDIGEVTPNPNPRRKLKTSAKGGFESESESEAESETGGTPWPVSADIPCPFSTAMDDS
jgi:hypothetical protein